MMTYHSESPVWVARVMRVALEVASWSKDPSTKVGAVLIRERCLVATGFNGFPRGMADTDLENREHKLSCTVHAEMNAIFNAMRMGIDVRGCQLYTTFPPCDRCSAHIIQAGIVALYTLDLPEPVDNETRAKRERWESLAEYGRAMFASCNVKYTKVRKVDVCKV